VYAVASAVVAFVVDGLYLRELARQSAGYPDPWFPAILASAIACLGVAAIGASLIRLPQLRHALLLVCHGWLFPAFALINRPTAVTCRLFLACVVGQFG
jgi:hypothetical protein